MNYCTVGGCVSEVLARGLCNRHYKQYRNQGIIKLAHPHGRHDMYGTPEYWAWSHMIQRCTNPNNSRYMDWGGRGIKVCGRYRHSFAAFYGDIGQRPEGLTLNRKDNDGHYSCGQCPECLSNGWPMNIEWSTVYVQQVNKRVRADNTSGHKNITWNRRHKLWAVSIQRENEVIFTGWFERLDDAVEAREAVLSGHTYGVDCPDKSRQRPAMGGDHNPSAKLTWGEVQRIRALWTEGRYYQREIGDMFGVNQTVISGIVLNKSWYDEEYAPRVVKRHKWQTKRSKDDLAA